MALKGLSSLLLIYNVQVTPTTAERSKSCVVYSASKSTYETEICDLFHEKCCETGCCPATEPFPWWVWTIIGTCIFFILFCWCFVKICKKKRRKLYISENNDAIQLEILKESSTQTE